MTVAPDSVTLHCLLTASEDTKSEALQTAAVDLGRLTDNLRSLGGQPRAVESENRALMWSAYSATTHAEYEHDDRTGKSRQTGRVTASVEISIIIRALGTLDRVAGVLAGHDALSVHAVAWEVDTDNPSWQQVRASAIRAAVQKGRDYAGALSGSLDSVEHIADVGLLNGESTPGRAVAAAGALRYGSDGGSETPALDPVPQELIAVIDARFIASVDAL